ncbi:unnamed protein product [Closterium sp. NIES-53]
MASARVLQQQGQPQRQQLQHTQQWGPHGPRSGGPSSGQDVGPCEYRILTGPGAGTTWWRPDNSAFNCYRCLDDLHRERFGPDAIPPHWPSRLCQGSPSTNRCHWLGYDLSDCAAFLHPRLWGVQLFLTPLRALVTVALVDPSVGPMVAHSTTTLPCPTAPSGVLTGYYIPSFSRNLVGVSHLHDLDVVTTFPLDEPVASCIVSGTGAPLATFHREPSSGLYSLQIGSHHTGSGQDGTAPSGNKSPRVARPASPLAYTAMHSLCRVSATPCPSLLLVPPNHGSFTDPALGPAIQHDAQGRGPRTKCPSAGSSRSRSRCCSASSGVCCYSICPCCCSSGVYCYSPCRAAAPLAPGVAPPLPCPAAAAAAPTAAAETPALPSRAAAVTPPLLSPAAMATARAAAVVNPPLLSPNAPVTPLVLSPAAAMTPPLLSPAEAVAPPLPSPYAATKSARASAAVASAAATAAAAIAAVVPSQIAPTPPSPTGEDAAHSP